MLKEFVQYLATALSKTIGDDLVAGATFPKSPKRCTVVMERGGEPNFYLADAGTVNIQILNRAEYYFDAREDAFLYFALLHASAGIKLSAVLPGTQDYYCNVIEASVRPQFIGYDENGLDQFSTNYVIRIREV